MDLTSIVPNYAKKFVFLKVHYIDRSSELWTDANSRGFRSNWRQISKHVFCNEDNIIKKRYSHPKVRKNVKSVRGPLFKPKATACS